MTIKPVVNQKSSKEETQEGTSQNSGGVRVSAHRNVVLNQLSTSDSQALPREKRVHTPHNFDNDSVVRHIRSPHKTLGRSKRDHYHNKRENRDRDKNASPSYHVGLPSVSGKKQTASSCSSPLASAVGGRSPKSTIPAGNSINHSNSASNNDLNAAIEEGLSGYNSGDEHVDQKDSQLTPDEWKKRDEAFSKVLSDRGLMLEKMEEDGACLFRAVSLQIYGDQDMHEMIRQQTMDYIYQNREYFTQFVTEDINGYVNRKRANHVHGNHIEIQAMSEMYNRSVELYCYQTEPINIFNPDQINNGNEPLRLSYQRCSHYNAITNPFKASVGVGLGLAGYRPDELDIKQVADAVRMSEELEIEKTMFEDKLKTTDWEATNEAIEEQIARESYLQWCRDNMQNSTQKTGKSTSTITSTEVGASAGGCSSTAHVTLDKSPKHNLDGSVASSISESLLREFRKSASPSPSNSASSSKNSSFEMDCSSPPESSKAAAASAATYSVQYYYSNASMGSNRRKKRSLNSPIEKLNTEIQPKKTKVNSQQAANRLAGDSESEEKTVTSSPSTSSTKDGSNQPRDEPMSEFYQSLLESSYTDDGSFVQLSEREMIQKALEESAMDFVKRCDGSKTGHEDRYGTTDEEYDSPSP